MRLTLVTFLIFILVSSSYAQNQKAYDGSLTLHLSDLPKFEDYKVLIESGDNSISIDLKSHPQAQSFRTVLSKGFSNTPTFAGHYVVITHGCGTICQVNWIIDTLTGKVIDRVTSSYETLYQVDSNLLILDAPSDWDNVAPEEFFQAQGPKYYLLQDNKLKLIGKINLGQYNKTN